MINSGTLSLLLKNNGISNSALEEKLYNTLILGIFEAVCKDILKEGTKTKAKEFFRKTLDKKSAAKMLVSKYTGCNLSDSEYETIATYLHAFFSKDPKRKLFDSKYKEDILKKQNHKCAICNKTINLSNSHLDHIIPFNYVGDILLNNYQMLCETCNTRKGTATYFEMSMLLLNRK